MLEVRAVAFDLGGVCVRIHRNWPDAMRAAGVAVLRDHGPLGGFDEFEQYGRGLASRETYFAALARHLGVTDEQAARAHMAVLREEYPGVAELIEGLGSRGIVCGCLSDTNEAHFEALFDPELYRFGAGMGVKVASHLVNACKPSDAMYGAFEQATGLEPAQIAYFEDGPANVEAALARGWNAHLIDPAGDTAAQMARALGL